MALVPLTVLATGLAFADTLHGDDLNTGGNATKEAGATGSASFYLTADNACNAGAASPVLVSVTSDQAWLTVDSPGSVSLAACGTAAARSVGYRVSASAPVGGRATVRGTASGGVAGNDGFNTAPAKFTVTVAAPSDTTPPVLTLPAPVTAEATSAAGTVVSYTATATDNVDGPVTPACTPASGATFALGQTTVTCTATDAHGNTATGTFAVTVRDTTAPVVTVPAGITAEAAGAAGRAVAFTASAADAVDGTVATACTPASGATFAIGATTVTCTAADARGNTGSAQFAVTVQDTTAPALSLPSDITAEATGPGGAAVSWTATSTDLVDGAVAVACSPASGTGFGLGATTVGCHATDARGNTATGSFTVTVRDTTGPVLGLPADVVTEATGPAGAVVHYTATAADAVAGPVATACSPASGATFPITTSPVSCSAGDDNGNTSTGGFSVTVRDTTPPSVVTPDGLTVEATSAAGAVATFSASAADVVDGAVATSCSTASGATFALGTTTVTCTATDAHGNTGSRSFVVVVVDTTAPALSVPATASAEATSAAGATVSWDASATDAVDGPLTPVCSPAPGTTFALGATTVTCTVADARHNTSSATVAVTVVDTTAPSLSVPDDVIVEATGSAGAAASFTATTTDLVDGAVTPSCSPASGATFALGATTVSCTVADARGNSAGASFTVTVVDTTPPALTVPGTMTVEATSAAGAAVPFSASALDAVDGAVTPVCTPAGGATFALGATTVSCTAADARGNHDERSFTVTVVDTTPPALSLPSSFTVEATGADGARVTYTATALDVVDGTVAVSCTPASGATFALGATGVSCSAADAAGNPATGGFTVSVQDHTPPGLHLPDPVTAEATGPAGAVVNYTATATDLVDGPVATSCSPASGATFPIATTSVGCSATDAHGNGDSGSFAVTVRDTTPPSVTMPGNMTAEATSPAGAAVTFTASAGDVVDGAVTPVCSAASGATFPLGTTTVSCTATDAHGNPASASFAVSVVDTTAPALTVPAAFTAEATGPGGAAVTFTATATDLVDGARAVSCTPASGATFALGATTVSCSVADTRGNAAAGSFTVTVVDTTAPVVVVVADAQAAAPGGSVATVTYAASASDLVDGPLAPACSPASGSTFTVGATTVSCSATDAHHNTGRASATVTVAYRFNGFYRPVDNPTVLNQVKAGQAVPVRFGLGGNQGTAVFAVGYPASGVMACNSAAPVDVIDQTVTAGSSSLSYDAGTDTYTYVWKTDKAWGGTCRQLVLQLADGTFHRANFTFTR